MLEVGTNTYCTLEEADSIVKKKFIIGSEYPYWVALEDEQKENLLIESATEIEHIPVAGFKNHYDQPLQFPRWSNFYREQKIPQEVKNAQVINAIAIMFLQLGTKQKDGKILTSLRAEDELKCWTCGGFKMESGRVW